MARTLPVCWAAAWPAFSVALAPEPFKPETLEPFFSSGSFAGLTAENSTLQERPIDLIQRIQGLAHVINYLRTRLPE
jgi:hypothetical protein